MSESASERGARGRLRFTVWHALICAVTIVIALGSVAVYSIREERASTACGFTPPGRQLPVEVTGWQVDWAWWPPGFVCVYSDSDGNVVVRRRW